MIPTAGFQGTANIHQNVVHPENLLLMFVDAALLVPKAKLYIPCTINTDYGAKFVVPFFSGSRYLALKSSLKSH